MLGVSCLSVRLQKQSCVPESLEQINILPHIQCIYAHASIGLPPAKLRPGGKYFLTGSAVFLFCFVFFLRRAWRGVR